MSEESSFSDSSSSISKEPRQRPIATPKDVQDTGKRKDSDGSSSFNEYCKNENKLVVNRKDGAVQEVYLPQNIYISNTTAYQLTSIPKNLRMLYVDVLCRGFHLNRSLMNSQANKFSYDQEKEGSEHSQLIFLSPDQAMGEIWRCIGRQLGRPYNQYDFKKIRMQLRMTLQKIGQTCEIPQIQRMQLPPSPELQQYDQLQKKKKILEQKMMKSHMQSIQDRTNELADIDYRKNQMITDVLSQQILKIEKQIFVKTVIGIRKLQRKKQNFVEIILEQSYPMIKWPLEMARQKLGQKIYQQKILAFEKFQKDGLFFKNDQSYLILVCHRCLHPLNRNLFNLKCEGRLASPIVKGTILTDPFIYNNRILHQNCGQKPTQKFIHPYLVYYLEKLNQKNSTPKALCNRYYCKKCKQSESQIYESGDCKYCGGDCNCSRCSGMDMLTKMMGIYLSKGGNWKKLSQQFLFQFQQKNLQTDRKSYNYLSESTEDKNKRLIKTFFDQGIFRKPQVLKNTDQYKIVYLTKDVSNFDRRALNYIQTKKRERQLKLKPSKDTLQEEKGRKNKMIARQRDLMARIQEGSVVSARSQKSVKQMRRERDSSSQEKNKGRNDVFYDQQDS